MTELAPVLPRYPVYIPSKGRAAPDAALTARFLLHDGVPFRLVVEPQEAAQYTEHFGQEHVLILPFSNLGQGSIPARNWIKDHATTEGHARHWQLDDNIRLIRRMWRGKRIPCNAGVALRACEDWTDRYENIAIAGLNYTMFAYTGGVRVKHGGMPPFYLNAHVYSCTLVLNSLPHRWRGRYNEDTDICLQVLGDGWCTVLINAFLAEKVQTMVMKGGNTSALYQGDGRLKMARALERKWPGVVETRRKWQRPQHVIKDNWRRFDTPLKRRVDAAVPAVPNEYGMRLRQVAPEIKSERLRALLAAQEQGQA